MTTVLAPFRQMSEEEFRRVTEVTYLGYVNGTRAALEHGGHGVVDPDVDCPEGGFHLGGGALQRPGIDDIGANSQRFNAKPFTGL